MTVDVIHLKNAPFWLWLLSACTLLPMLYLLSIGPLIWIESRGVLDGRFWTVAVIYAQPYNWAYDHEPEWMRPALDRYEEFWSR